MTLSKPLVSLVSCARVCSADAKLSNPELDKIQYAYAENETADLQELSKRVTTCQTLDIMWQQNEHKRLPDLLVKVASALQGIQAKVNLCVLDEACAVKQMEEILASYGSTALFNCLPLGY